MEINKYTFTRGGWDDLNFWIAEDRKMVKKISNLLKDIMRNGPLAGIGKPEPLVGDKSGWFSRRINDEHRLVYRITDDYIEVASCRTHYGDK
jgi:toxin YoeB